jgi:ParB-like chromosome segregation protein Spo0J
MEDLLISTVTGNEGEPLTPIEKAGVIRDLQGCNMELDVIAKRLGYTLLHVKNLLSILEAPREVREMVQEGKVSAAVAVQTVKEHGKNAGTILRSGLEVAQSKGKDKVTPKHLREVSPQKAERKSAKDGKEGRASKPAEAPEKLAPTHADEAIDAALQRGAGWIVQEVQAGDEAPFISLVAATLGLKDTAALQELVAKLR